MGKPSGRVLQLRHAIYRLYGCDRQLLDNGSKLLRILCDTAGKAGMKAVGHKLYKFSPQGVTCVVLLAQSHIYIHTYPEDCKAIVGILACSPRDFQAACRYLVRSLRPLRVGSESRMVAF